MSSVGTPTLVLVDISDAFRVAFSRFADQQGLEVLECVGDALILRKLARTVLCVVEGSGDAVLAQLSGLRKQMSTTPIVVISENVSVSAAVSLMRAGVRDVIELPAPASDVVARVGVYASDLSSGTDSEMLIGRSPAMLRVRSEIEAVAPMQSTVLLTGETGTGKGLAARLIHGLSTRRERPFVQVDCGVLAGSIIESELFGHERGAFTGAINKGTGRFELAGDGTIFLDEIGELSPDLQVKLLRVLEDRSYERLGGRQTLRMSARVLAATNRDLEQQVRAGSFRADLMYRLNVYRLELPALRERLEDLPSLIQHGFGVLSKRLQVSVPTLSDAMYQKLAEQRWPGNVRELMNLLERMMIVHHANILDDESFDALLAPVATATPTATTARRHRGPMPPAGSDAEREILEAEFVRTGGNVARMARRLGLPRGTLRYRMSLHDLPEVSDD